MMLLALLTAVSYGSTAGAAGIIDNGQVVLDNGEVEVRITSTWHGAPAGSVTMFTDRSTGINLVGGGWFCAIHSGDLIPMDGTLTALSDTEAVFSSPGLSSGSRLLPVSIQVSYRLAGRGMEVQVGLKAAGQASIGSPLEMQMDLSAFNTVSFSNQSALDRVVGLTGARWLYRISGDQVVRAARSDGLLEACFVFPNPALAILALEDAAPPGRPRLSFRFFDTEPPRETAVGPYLHSVLPVGYESGYYMRIALEPGFIPVYLSAHPSGLERSASWILDDLPFRHPPDTTLWAFSESSTGGEWVSARLISLLESHPEMKMNWIVLPDAILAPNCDSMWAEPGYEDSWSHWHSVWRLADFATPDYRRWLRNIQDDAYPWAGQVTLGSHGYHHTPSPDSAWDPFHEFITYEPAEHLERFRVMMADFAATGLDTTLIRAFRFPGHRTSQSGLAALAAHDFDLYCNGIRWYEQMGGEPFLDQYLSHYVEPGGEIWGTNTVWWGDYPPAPYSYAETVLARGKHALLGSHPDRMLGWGNPAVYAAIDSICTVFEEMPHFGWLFPEEYGRFLQDASRLRFSSISRAGDSITADFSGGAAAGQTMAADIPGAFEVIDVTLDGASLPFDRRSSRLFVVLPALSPGRHTLVIRIRGTGGVEGPEPGEPPCIRVENPCRGSIRLQFANLFPGNDLSIEVVDCAGRVVSREGPLDLSEHGEGITIGMPGMPPGVYFVVLHSADGGIVGSAGTVLLD